MSKYYINWPRSEYSKDLCAIANHTIEYLKKYRNIPKKNQNEDIIIFDIDDTLLYTDPNEDSELEFSFKKILNNEEIIISAFPANIPIVRLLNEAKSLNYKIIIITSRPPSSENDTIDNLKMFNIHYDKIFFNPCKMNPDGDYPQFKATYRKKLESIYNIVCTIGDALTDIYISSPKTAIVKLPEKNSNCSYIYIPEI